MLKTFNVAKPRPPEHPLYRRPDAPRSPLASPLRQRPPSIMHPTTGIVTSPGSPDSRRLSSPGRMRMASEVRKTMWEQQKSYDEVMMNDQARP
jgi:hypothetical protein